MTLTSVRKCILANGGKNMESKTVQRKEDVTVRQFDEPTVALVFSEDKAEAIDKLYREGEFKSADELIEWFMYCHDELTTVCQGSRVDQGLPEQSLKELRKDCYEIATGSFLDEEGL